MLTQSPTCQPFLVAIKQLRLSIHTRCSPTTVRMHTSWSLGTQPQSLPLAPIADCSRKQQMRLPGAPQLSVHVNQMIAKAKHHWCNSRIDKCCSLRLIQRRVATELDLIIATSIEALWVANALSTPHDFRGFLERGGVGGEKLGPKGPAKIDEVTLMRPIHGNL